MPTGYWTQHPGVKIPDACATESKCRCILCRKGTKICDSCEIQSIPQPLWLRICYTPTRVESHGSLDWSLWDGPLEDKSHRGGWFLEAVSPIDLYSKCNVRWSHWHSKSIFAIATEEANEKININKWTINEKHIFVLVRCHCELFHAPTMAYNIVLWQNNKQQRLP